MQEMPKMDHKSTSSSPMHDDDERGARRGADQNDLLEDSAFVKQLSLLGMETQNALLAELNVPIRDRVKFLATGKLDQKKATSGTPPGNDERTFYQKLLEEMPVINIIYDLLFDDPPGLDQIKDSLNTVGVLSALVLSVALTVPGSYDYDTLDAFVERFADGGVYNDAGCDASEGERRLGLLITDTVNSISFSGATIFMVTMFYISICSSQMSELSSEYISWWYYVRWLLFAAFVSTFTSVLYIFLMLKDVIIVAFPDYYIMKHKLCGDGYQSWPFVAKSSWGFTFGMVGIVLWTTVAMSFLITSLAARARFRSASGITAQC